jgi:hypothetical protein
MANDIADFLRRAAERYAQQQTGRPASPLVLQADIVEDADVVEEAEILDPGEASGEEVASHVRQHMDTSNFTRRAASLGASVDQSDDRMEAHLQQVFVHKLGQLAKREPVATPVAPGPEIAAVVQTSTPAASPATAAGIVAMLQDRNQLRYAVLLSEILKRPEY